MAELGDEHRFHDVVFSEEDPSDGVDNGALVLIGNHDFTLSTYFYGSARFPLDVLAQELKDAGLKQVTGGVRVQGEFVYDGYAEGTYDAAANRATVATQFKAALAAQGISVSGAATTSTSFSPPAGAVEMAHWDSLPLSVGCFTMNVESHNEFADDLSPHIGFEKSGQSTFAAGVTEVSKVLGQLGVDNTGFVLHDGSGLSHDNRVSAHQVVGLLSGMVARPEGLAWTRTFAVAGIRGTIGSRMTGADTKGRFWGKTGTLTGVVALSGLLEHKHDGQRYFVSEIMNSVGNASAGRAALDAVVEALAKDWRKLGPRPEAPVLKSVHNDANGVTANVVWSEVSGAKGYLVWRSRDGKVWDRKEARYVTKTSHRTVALAPTDGRLYVKITAVGDAGESDPSDVYGAGIAKGASRVLLVDGDDRWQSEPLPENVLQRGHDFLVPAAAALDGGFDSCANEAVEDGSIELGPYAAVIWSLGKQSEVDQTFDAVEQDLVRTYVKSGGSLLVSGSEIGFDLDAKGTDADRSFLHDVLHAGYVNDDGGSSTVVGVGALSSVGRFSFESPGRLQVDYPDELLPQQGSKAVVNYVGGSGGAAGVLFESGAQRIMVLGFPLESVDGPEARSSLVSLVVGG